jgi:hypothetical protein
VLPLKNVKAMLAGIKVIRAALHVYVELIRGVNFSLVDAIRWHGSQRQQHRSPAAYVSPGLPPRISQNHPKLGYRDRSEATCTSWTYGQSCAILDDRQPCQDDGRLKSRNGPTRPTASRMCASRQR